MLAAAGVFAPNGDFHLAPPGGWQELAELWRHTVLRSLGDAGALADWQITKLKNWRHSRAGVRTIFIDFGYAEELREPPDFTVNSFTEAAAVILKAS